MTDEELLHVRALLDETKKRHDVLEVQAARFGRSRVPAEIAIELRETEESLQRLNAKLRIVTVPVAVQEATGPESSIDVLRHKVNELGEQIGTIARHLEGMILHDRGVTDDWRNLQAVERRKGTRERRAVEMVLFMLALTALYFALR